jgi:glycosyltransferase involved in cell wall biosynthesis
VFNIAPKEKIHVVPLGFDLTKFTQNKEQNRAEFRLKYNLKNDQLAIGIIGRLAPIKNHSLFIESIAFLKQNGTKHFKAFIIGDGDTRNTIEEACNLHNVSWSNNPTDNVDVIFTSWITNVEWALHGLDIVTLTSLNEGTPVSIIEAQAAGKYVVSTNVGGIEDVLHPECGLLSEINDKNAFFTNLLSTCNNSSSLSVSSKKGEEWAISKYSYTRLVSDMNKLYAQLLKRV